MLAAVVLSEPASGGTTFIGLIYTAQVRLAAEQSDAFRFSAPPASLRRATPLYEHLVAGEFPDLVDAEGVAEIRFELAFNPPRHWGPFRRSPAFEPRYRAECRWVRCGFSEVAAALESGGGATRVLDPLTNFTVPIFVLDSRSSASGNPGPEPADRDPAIVRILEGLVRAQDRGEGRPGPRIHPTIVFTKLDLLAENATPTVPGEDVFNEEKPTGSAAQIARGLVERLVPRTAAFCRSTPASLTELVPFLCYLRPVLDAPAGERRIQTRTLSDHRHEPIYPFSQLQGLLDRLGDLSRQSP